MPGIISRNRSRGRIQARPRVHAHMLLPICPRLMKGHAFKNHHEGHEVTKKVALGYSLGGLVSKKRI